jgi:trehalose/maltose hydrolase-like predicted phosphorylase
LELKPTLTRQIIAAGLCLSASLFFSACGSHPDQTSPDQPAGPLQVPLAPDVQHASDLFSQQKAFDQWTVSTTDPSHTIDAYLPLPGVGNIYGVNGLLKTNFISGQYKNGVIIHVDHAPGGPPHDTGPGSYGQSLNFYTGSLTCHSTSGTLVYGSSIENMPWQEFWQRYDIGIVGDPEAQQVTHANMFYLAGSGVGNQSIPPMGLSSTQYNGHIFWDAEIWMMPALIVQHPGLAYGILDYRFKRLQAAEALAKAHGFKGAEFPWESADTGQEEAPAGFDKERHITADIAYSAWQYYLWTGDKQTLESVCWPILKDNADYWVSRAVKGSDGKYHINNVIGPDETAGLINDDAWTNAIVAVTLRDAMNAADRIGQPVDPKWTQLLYGLDIPKDSSNGFYIEYPGMPDRMKAKQADTQMLIFPLNLRMTSDCAAKTLDYAIAHTITVGPAMTNSINAIDAARLGRAQQSLDLFHASYRPFMRGPWDAFAEKRSTNGVYFCTGMGGCLQTVLYGFAGLQLVEPGQTSQGTLIAKGVDASLYVSPHLPPGWTELLLRGVQFQGHGYTIDIRTGNKLTITKMG